MFLKNITRIKYVCAAAFLLVGANALAASFDGTIDVLQIDYRDHSERQHYLLQDNGERIRLSFPQGIPTDLQSGKRIQIEGELLAPAAGSTQKTIKVNSLSTLKTAAHDGPHDIVVGGTAPAQDTRSVGVFIINSTNPANVSSKSALASSIFTGSQSSKLYFEASSYNQLTLKGDIDNDGSPDIFGPITVPAAAMSSCDVYAIASAAQDAVKANGIDLTKYRHRVYALPTDAPCGWAGLGNVGCGTSCSAWVIGTGASVLSHELGHNMGMMHASTDANNDGVIDAEYGDRTDVMGNGYGQSNAPHRVERNWTAIDPAMVKTVTTSQTVTLDTLDEIPNPAAPAVRIIKIAKPDTAAEYFLALRTAPAPFGVGTADNNRVSLHTHKGNAQTLFIRSLGTGDTFTDAVNKISITVVSTAAQGATVYIAFDGGNCTRATPTLTLMPASATSAPNRSIAVSAQLLNNDSVGCTASTFVLDQTLPTGISASMTPAQLTVAPGFTANASWKLTTAANLPAGTYWPVLRVLANTDHAQTKARFTLENVVADTTAPSAPSGLVAVPAYNQVALSWNAATDAESGVASYNILRNGLLIGNSTGLSYTDTTVAASTSYRYSIVAVNGVGLSTSSPEIPVSTPAAPVVVTGPVCFYENVDYQGASLCLNLGGGSLPLNWQRKVSSIRVAAGYIASVTDGLNETGRRLTLARDTRSLIPLQFNDQVLSFNVSRKVSNGLTNGGLYKLVASHSGLVANVLDASTTAGAALIQWPSWGGDNQKFRVDARSDYQVRLINLKSGMCVSPKSGIMTPATALTQETCDLVVLRYWYLRPLGNQQFELINARTGQCAEVQNAALSNGAVIQQNFCTNAPSQIWKVEAAQ